MRREDGDLSFALVWPMQELELGNPRLGKAVADLTMDKLILAEAVRGDCLEPRGAFAPASNIPEAS